MEHESTTLVISALVITTFCSQVQSYCMPGADTKISVIRPFKQQHAKVPLGGEITLEVRYKGNPKARWYLNGKEILATTKSKHFEFVNVGISHKVAGPVLKIKQFKKEVAGLYKIVINNAGCTYSKSINVQLEKKFNLVYYVGVVLKKLPYFKTKAGVALLAVGFGLLFIIIPLMICAALCSRISYLKREIEEGGSQNRRTAQKEQQPLLQR